MKLSSLCLFTVCLPNLARKLCGSKHLVCVFSTKYCAQCELSKSSSCSRMKRGHWSVCAGDACSSVCSPQASPAFTKPFAGWPEKACQGQNKTRKMLLPESLCLSGDSCAHLLVIPRPSREKGCLLTAELRTGPLSAAATLQKGGESFGPMDAPLQKPCLLVLVHPHVCYK